MNNQIRPYAWGSRTALADLLGEPSPAPGPQAELWIGAHPGASSFIAGDPGRSLAEVIASDPVGTVGRRRMPFSGPGCRSCSRFSPAANLSRCRPTPTPHTPAAGSPVNRRPGYPSCLLYTSPSPRDGLLSRM